MPIEVEETWDSRHQTRSASSTQEIEYIINGTMDDDEANNAMLAYTPATWIVGGDTELPISEAKITERLAEFIYKGVVTYGRSSLSSSSPGEVKIGFDTTGNTSKVTQSLGTVAYAPEGVVAPNFNGAIGVTKNSIEGADVMVPGCQFHVTLQVPAASMTMAYIDGLARLTGNYNNAAWGPWAAGEVRFDGAVGDQQATGQPVDVTYKFTISPNAEGFTVAGITVALKRGWQYLWVLYQEQEDSSASYLVQTPIAVYVEDLPNCQPKDFSALGFVLA